MAGAENGDRPRKCRGQSPFSNRNAQGKPILPTTFRDGTGNTVLFAEKYASAWLAKTGSDPSKPGGQTPFSREGGCNPCLPATGHNAMNAAMADGSVRALAPGMDRRVWWALVTPAGRDRAE